MDSVSSRQFREFRDFSAIAENHWPYKYLFSIFSIPTVFTILFATSVLWWFQFRCLFIFMPKNTKLSTNSTIVPFILKMGKITFFCGIWNTIAFVFFTFNDNLFIFSHSVTLFNSCSVVLASLCLVCAPHNVVSSAYVMKLKCEVDCAMSFMYIMNNKGPSIEPWGTPVVILPSSEGV